ncbi:MAG TPA: DUF4293 domain-containing protein [Bacteroidales bacterium]|nr:DUF4293 domain-containing protein [Bacteroidales bacterium]HPR59283.1 DUF4293 domain-containing protein [Bacteroidales bacterium]HRW96438.1 DUF4293 domain-containing protein [Bacteroidales bacterium]
MIQRIQSFYLLLVVVAGILLFFLPLATYLSELGVYRFYLYGIKDMVHDPFGEPNPSLFSYWFGIPLSAVQGLIVLVGVITIFQYRKRLLQIRLNRLNIFLQVILVGGIFFFSNMIESKVLATADYGIGNVLPLISIILLFLANNGIRKDEKLIRSADRLR